MNKRYKDWLSQAENDQLWAQSSLASGYYSQVCFIAQQVAEKCLKSIAYYRGFDFVKGHSVLAITKELGINGKLARAASRLDQYYISTRYPDAVPEGAPYEFFDKEQAVEALEFSALFLQAARAEVMQDE